MSIDTAILGLLSWRSMTGYDIKKIFENSIALYWSGNNNQIYTTLVRLHKNGFVAREVELRADSPSRKIYSITEKGREELHQLMASGPKLPQLIKPFLIQLAWVDQLTSAELDALLVKYEEELQSQVLMLQVQAQRADVSSSRKPRETYINAALARSPREAVIWSMLQENWISFYQNELDWVRALRKKLNKI